MCSGGGRQRQSFAIFQQQRLRGSLHRQVLHKGFQSDKHLKDHVEQENRQLMTLTKHYYIDLSLYSPTPNIYPNTYIYSSAGIISR